MKMNKIVTGICAFVLLATPFGGVANAEVDPSTQAQAVSASAEATTGETAQTVLTADWKNPVNAKTPDNPTYMVVVPNMTGIESADVSFTGAFETARVSEMQEISGNSVISFTKAYTVPEIDVDGNWVNHTGEIVVEGVVYPLEDTYVKGVNVNSKGTRDMADLGNAGNMFGSFAGIVSAVSGGNPILMAFQGFAGIQKTISFFQGLFTPAKTDPTQQKLDDIIKQLKAISGQIDFNTSQLQTQLTRQQYEGYLNAFMTQHNAMSNKWYATKIKPLGDCLVQIAKDAGMSVTDPSQLDLSDTTQTDKIKNYLNQSNNYGSLLVLQADLQQLYANTTATVYNDSFITDTLNYYDSIDGSNNPFISSVTKTDTFTIFGAYESILYDWNVQTFSDREQYNQTVLNEIGILSGPLHYAISWDITANQEVVKDNTAAIEKLDPNDPSYAAMKTALQSQITAANYNISKDESNEEVMGNKLNMTLQTYKDAEDKLTKEEEEANAKDVSKNNVGRTAVTADDIKNLQNMADGPMENTHKILNYRVNKSFYRLAQAVKSDDYLNLAAGDEKITVDPYDLLEPKGAFYGVRLDNVKYNMDQSTASSFTTAEYNTMTAQAAVRGTSLKDEIATLFASPIGAYQLQIPDTTVYSGIWDNDCSYKKTRKWANGLMLNYNLSEKTMTIVPDSSNASGAITTTAIGTANFDGSSYPGHYRTFTDNVDAHLYQLTKVK